MAYSKADKSIIKDLKKAKVELTGDETSAELAVLAKDNSIEVPEVKDVDSVSVEFQDPHKGPSTRTFSREIHGDDFEDTAEQFAKKFAGKIIE